MKSLFTISLLFLLAMTFAAWKLRPAPDPLGRTILVWATDDNPMREDQAEGFSKMFPRDVITIDQNNQDIEKVIVQSLAGVGPDLFSCFTSLELSAYVKAGVAWDITDELKKRGIDIQKDCWKANLASGIYEGRIYGFPCNVAVNGIWYHKDLFDAEGVPYPKGPWTWDQFVEVAKRMTKRDASGKIIRYGILNDWKLDWYQYILQAGGRLYSPDGTRCVADSPEDIAAIQFLYDLTYKYHVAPTFAESESMASSGGYGQGPANLFADKKGAMALGGRWWLVNFRDYPQLHIAAAEAPYGKRRVFRGYGKSTSINAASPHREEALNFFVYQMSHDYNKIINRQADGIGPVMKYCQGDEFLHDPAHPEEDYNQVWSDMMAAAEPDESSVFANGQVVRRIIEKHLDMIRANQESPTAGMHRVAEEVNQLIQETISRDPDLRSKYEKLMQKSARQERQEAKSAKNKTENLGALGSLASWRESEPRETGGAQ